MPDSTPELKSARDGHIFYVYNDPDFIADIAALKDLEKKLGPSRELDELERDIAGRWLINRHDVFRYRVGEVIPLPYHETTSAQLIIEPFKGEFSIKFQPFTSRAEILEQWAKFENIRAEMFPIRPTKRKPPKRPDLIYAVFKQYHQLNLTFPQIFELYSSGNLPGYNGPTDLQDEEVLERLYREHNPAS